jgi:hypothetical protein
LQATPSAPALVSGEPRSSQVHRTELLATR